MRAYFNGKTAEIKDKRVKYFFNVTQTKPVEIIRNLITADNRKFITADNKAFIVKGV